MKEREMKVYNGDNAKNAQFLDAIFTSYRCAARDESRHYQKKFAFETYVLGRNVSNCAFLQASKKHVMANISTCNPKIWR